MPSTIRVEVDKDSSMAIRKIENGYIVSESGTKGKGRNKEWYNKEIYTKTNPVNMGVFKNGTSNGGGIKLGGKK